MDQWENECKNQNKLECFLALNRKCILPKFFYTVRSQSGNRKRQTQTKKEWVYVHCDTGEVETETVVREKCFDQLSNLMPQFSSSAEMDQMQMSLGERLINFSKIQQSANLIHVCFTHAVTRKTNYNI